MSRSFNTLPKVRMEKITLARSGRRAVSIYKLVRSRTNTGSLGLCTPVYQYFLPPML